MRSMEWRGTDGRIEEGSEATFECEIDGMHFIADLSHLESERGEALKEAQVNSSAATLFGKPTLSFTFGVVRIHFPIIGPLGY